MDNLSHCPLSALNRALRACRTDDVSVPVLLAASPRTSCYTVFVSPKSQLRNVTVSLEEDVARWARIEAARRDTSVSRMLGDLLKERMTAQDAYEKAMRRALGRKPFLRSTGKYLTREEAHDRSRLR